MTPLQFNQILQQSHQFHNTNQKFSTGINSFIDDFLILLLILYIFIHILLIKKIFDDDLSFIQSVDDIN